VTPLPRGFYDRSTLVVAQELLGKMVMRRLATGETLCGIIVETEGYLTGDPASHAFRGETPRNRTMFGPPGHAYVCFTYGMHMMLNIVTERAGLGEAVLIRALQPIAGIEDMSRHRGGLSDVRQLTNGPGKLAQAFGITRGTDDGKDVTDPMSDLVVTSHENEPFETVAATRIGLSRVVESPWRYYIRDNPYVSRR
jgi:DNA-3-methyladenine glycosylase